MRLARHIYGVERRPASHSPFTSVSTVYYSFSATKYWEVKAKAVPLHAMEAHGGEEVQLLLILNLGH
jgi:hypothetical protein